MPKLASRGNIGVSASAQEQLQLLVQREVHPKQSTGPREVHHPSKFTKPMKILPLSFHFAQTLTQPRPAVVGEPTCWWALT